MWLFGQPSIAQNDKHAELQHRLEAWRTAFQRDLLNRPYLAKLKTNPARELGLEYFLSLTLFVAVKRKIVSEGIPAAADLLCQVLREASRNAASESRRSLTTICFGLADRHSIFRRHSTGQSYARGQNFLPPRKSRLLLMRRLMYSDSRHCRKPTRQVITPCTRSPVQMRTNPVRIRTASLRSPLSHASMDIRSEARHGSVVESPGPCTESIRTSGSGLVALYTFSELLLGRSYSIGAVRRPLSRTHGRAAERHHADRERERSTGVRARIGGRRKRSEHTAAAPIRSAVSGAS